MEEKRDKKYVYSFQEGDKSMKELLGGKGANLSEMTSIGIPVPPGFTITTEACKYYSENDNQWPEILKEEVDQKLKELEEKMGSKLGDNSDPLLVSVRSGAAVSMPGMMDTVLNLGLNDESVKGLAEKVNPRFAYDSYRRLIQMFGNVVLGIEGQKFEEVLEDVKKTKGVENDVDLDEEDLKNVISKYKEVIKKETGEEFPQDSKEQLKKSIDAVFSSWNNKRAISYRRLNNITGLIGTAVNVQTMVFGNSGDNSGTGVAFTRNPSTGENKFYGEYLINAQGEDVVAGIRTPQPIETLNEKMPEIYNQLVEIRDKLEKHYKNMQDIEFTIQDKKLYILQTRNGKRTAHAAVKIAVDMVEEGILEKDGALMQIEAKALDQLLHKRFDSVALEKAEKMGTGLPASPGAAVGKVVFDSDKVLEYSNKGEETILVRQETSPEDIEGMHSAKGILTSRGGMTSHAAVVARGMGKCCVAGCSDINISYEDNKFTVNVEGGEKEIKEGDYISIEGSTGNVYEGKIPLVDPEVSDYLDKILSWSNEFKKMGVRTNADTPNDTKKALEFGAEGIGLCRTEHMFFEGERIKAVREMILSSDKESREKALEKILPFQKKDFEEIFRVLEGKPITIRLLDPPLHEFLPDGQEEIEGLAKDLGVESEKVKSKIEELSELNPMLGHRGCRLGIAFPEITEMQAKAIFEAAKQVKSEGIDVQPEVMIPLVGNLNEFENQKGLIEKVAKEVLEGQDIGYKIGTMIEVPRAAIISHKIAEKADFFSFGTNDLTQMTLGFSRDDAGRFLTHYLENSIMETDPFQTIDKEGVGYLVEFAVSNARKVKDIKCGICGEHGGDPESIEFCYNAGLNYVSCSPFRVPIARLAAAQAAIKKK